MDPAFNQQRNKHMPETADALLYNSTNSLAPWAKGLIAIFPLQKWADCHFPVADGSAAIFSRLRLSTARLFVAPGQVNIVLRQCQQSKRKIFLTAYRH